MLLLIDGDYLLARMLHTPALWGLTAEVDYFRPEGDNLVPRRGIMHTGGVYGAIKSLLGALGRFPITQALLVFGKGRSPRRLALYPDYKGTISKTKVVREPQDEAAHQEYEQARMDNRLSLIMLLPCLGVRVYEASFEADDVIAYVARNLENQGKSVVIMSDDKDMLTLVTQYVTVFRPIADQHVHALNYQELVGVQGPAQYLLAKAMMGDQSDCIPGVPGVGEKTAMRLAARTNGTLESLLGVVKASTSAREKHVLEHQDIVQRNLGLMDMAEEYVWIEFDPGTVLEHVDKPVQCYIPKVVEHLGRLKCHGLLADAPNWLLLFQRLT